MMGVLKDLIRQLLAAAAPKPKKQAPGAAAARRRAAIERVAGELRERAGRTVQELSERTGFAVPSCARYVRELEATGRAQRLRSSRGAVWFAKKGERQE